MQHHPVKSSMVESLAHKGTTMHVKFKSGGVYEYTDVSPDTFATIKNAPSVGKRLNELGMKGVKR
jgi:KTSC domain